MLSAHLQPGKCHLVAFLAEVDPGHSCWKCEVLRRSIMLKCRPRNKLASDAQLFANSRPQPACITAHRKSTDALNERSSLHTRSVQRGEMPSIDAPQPQPWRLKLEPHGELNITLSAGGRNLPEVAGVRTRRRRTPLRSVRQIVELRPEL